MSRILALMFILLGVLTAIASAWSAPVFCKCTCFSNYTIIPLGPHDDDAENTQQSPQSSEKDKPPPLFPGSSLSSSSSKYTTGSFDKPLRTQPRNFVHFSANHVVTAKSLDEAFANHRKRGQDEESLGGPFLGRGDGAGPIAPESKQEHQQRRLEERASSSSCAQCNRAFCLSHHLPICEDAEEKDVMAMCFQRDSRKDQIIVWVFILGTGGLLGWAGIKRLLEMREARRPGVSGRSDLPWGGYRPAGTQQTPRDSVS